MFTLLALNWRSDDHPVVGDPWAQAILLGVMLVLMSIYTWASVALGLKPSNLTHRGIIESGPYRWVRHPAYIAKNLFGWCGMTPWILTAAAGDPRILFAGPMGMFGWSAIYAVRIGRS